LLNEVNSLFGILKYVCDIVVKKFTFAISSADEFLYLIALAVYLITGKASGENGL